MKTKNELTRLIEEAKEIIESERGSRIELADYVGVSAQQISNWIFSRVANPNGAHTLKIKAWVDGKKVASQRPKNRTR